MLARFQLLILRKIFCFAELAMMVVYIRGLQGKDERSNAVAEQSEVNPDFCDICALLCRGLQVKDERSDAAAEQSEVNPDCGMLFAL